MWSRVTIILSLILSVAVSGKFQKRTFNHPSRPNPKDLTPQITSLADHDVISKSFPKNFDWCEKGFCSPNWNQHIPQYCGACYLHGSLSAYQDRALIQGVGVSLSRQSYLNCGPGRNSSNGCDGGEPASVFQYMKDYGIPDETCMPYNATDNTKFGDVSSTCPEIGECMNCMYVEGADPPRTECWPVTAFTRYRAKHWGAIRGEHAMIREIFEHGPITCGIACPDGFAYDYREGIFHDKTGNRDIDHDIEIVGWGEEDGVKFWNVRNSWGSYWGLNGFVKVVRGVDNLAIESDCTWVKPDLSELKRVSGKHPALGGSHYGLVDMTGDTEKLSAAAVLSSHLETTHSESLLVSTPVISNTVFSSHVLLFAILSLLIGSVFAVVWFTRAGQQTVWSSSSKYAALP